jgi:hypothetical protein
LLDSILPWAPAQVIDRSGCRRWKGSEAKRCLA